MSNRQDDRIALVAITKHGCDLAARIARSLPRAHIAAPQKFASRLEEFKTRLQAYDGPSRKQIGPLFERFEQIVFFVSLGAVVRLIAPHLRAKETDPGVLVVDDAAQFVIPVLSGHIGGANEFAGRLADLLGATAVLTTASDARKTIAPDILGRELGWSIEATKETITAVSAHLVNDDPVALIQEAGSRNWWRRDTPLPANIDLYECFEDVDCRKYEALLWITHRPAPDSLSHRQCSRLIIYRPPNSGDNI